MEFETNLGTWETQIWLLFHNIIHQVFGQIFVKLFQKSRFELYAVMLSDGPYQ